MTNIKDVKLNDRIKFNNNFHTITNYEIDCSNMIGEVVEIEKDNSENKGWKNRYYSKPFTF